MYVLGSLLRANNTLSSLCFDVDVDPDVREADADVDVDVDVDVFDDKRHRGR